MSSDKYIKSEIMYGNESEEAPKEVESKPAEYFEHSITINQFIADIKLRYPEEFNKARQIKVYFFTDKSVYYNEIKSTYGLRTTTKNYAYIRPEIITFTSITPEKKVINQVLNGGLDVYQDYGIRFETHIPRHNSEEFRHDREVLTDSKVNILLINTAQQTYTKKAGRWDLMDKEINYYDWTTRMIKETQPDYKYVMKELYPKADQFESLEDTMEKNDDGELTF